MRWPLVLTALSAFCLAEAQTGAAAHWRLDEATGTTASDSSGNGNHGALAGFAAPGWGTGVHGGALTFSGTQHVNCNMNLGLPAYDSSGSPFSITAWVNGPPQDDDRLYSEGSSSNNSPLYTLGSGRSVNGTMDRFQLFVRTDTGVILKNTQSMATVFDNSWHHVAVVDSGGVVTVFIDGVPDGANFNYTITGPNTGIDRVALGAVLRAGTCCAFTGSLDDVRVYPFSLTAGDVAVVMNDGTLQGAFQVNRAEATLTVAGASGSLFTAANAGLSLGQAFDMTLSTTLGGQPWELGLDAGLAIPNAAVFTNNIVNLDLGSPGLTLLNGSFSSGFGVAPGLPGPISGGTSASAVLFMMAPQTPVTVSLQFGLLSPTNPDGFVASAPAEVVVQ